MPRARRTRQLDLMDPVCHFHVSPLHLPHRGVIGHAPPRDETVVRAEGAQILFGREATQRKPEPGKAPPQQPEKVIEEPVPQLWSILEEFEELIGRVLY